MVLGEFFSYGYNLGLQVRQKVWLNNEFFDWCDILSGIPPGSVLGSVLLFLIYINDRDEYIVSKLDKFADDTKLCRGISNNNDADILRSDLNQIYQWPFYCRCYLM